MMIGSAGPYADISKSCFIDPSNLLKRKREDWVVSIGVGDEFDIVDLPFVEGDVNVVYLCEVLRKLSDPTVGSRDCLLADPMGDRVKHWTGTQISDFIQSVGDEMNWKVVKMLGDDAFSMVVYEAYKMLEEDFTVVMQSTLQMKERYERSSRLAGMEFFFI